MSSIGMTHIITDNTYIVKDVNGEVLLTITLTDEPGNQVVIRTKSEVYAGPISLISFNPDTK